MFMYVGLLGHSAVLCFLCLCFFRVLCFFVGLLIVRLCFIGDILLFIDLFSCIAASLFNKLRRSR